jgi:predicted dehydrogenase
MEKIPLCLVGCGGMGHRHIMAYKVLEESGIGNIELIAVCDVQRQNAEFGAREVERLLGRKPMIFTDLDQDPVPLRYSRSRRSHRWINASSGDCAGTAGGQARSGGEAAGERNGEPVVLRLEGKELRGKEIFALLPDFHLDEITERLFGVDVVEYEMPLDEPHPGYAVDAKHLAIEYHDFGRAILTGGQPEVDGLTGMKAVAAIVGAYESAAVEGR